MLRLPRRPIAALASVAVALGPLCGTTAHAATRADYEACQAADEANFRQRVEELTQKSLAEGIKGFDYPSAIAIEWRRLGLDDIVDKRVDLAVDEVRRETSWAGLAQSLVSKEKAQELAVAVAERVYRSDAMRGAIEGLATGVGREIGTAIERASQDAAGPALECLRSFLGPRYGTAIASVVSADVERDFGVKAGAGATDVSTGAVLRQSSEGITGAAILLLRRQLANMATRIGQRLAGSVLSRLVTVAAGGVGLVLIAKDMWELRNGVLPIIAGEMKSEQAKAGIRSELAKSISDQVSEHVREIGTKSADRIVEAWHEFRRAHTKVLDLAERHTEMRSFLDSVPPAALGRLDEVASLVLATEGEAGIMRRVGDGTLATAVRTMPEPAMQIARDTRSVASALRWSEIAGDRLSDVVGLELYKLAPAESFTRSEVTTLLALDDRLAITRLAGLDREARTRLFELAPDDLKRLARSLSQDEMSTLSGYLTGLDPAPRARILAAVAAAPAKMKVLASARVRDAILASRDQAAAVEMMLRDGRLSTDILTGDLTAVWNGEVSPILLWDRHPIVVVLGVVLAIVLLLMLRRLFSPRRHAPTA